MTTTRRVRAAAAAAVAALALAACSSDQLGAAAVVGDQRISIAELQDLVTSYADSVPEGSPATGDATALQQTILERRVQHELLQEMAAREGVSVTEADIDRSLADVAAQQGGDLTALLAQNGFTTETVREAAEDQLIVQQLLQVYGSQEAFLAAIDEVSEEIGVEVNPRYGAWEGASLDRTVTGSISTPAPGSEVAEPEPPAVGG